MTTFGKQPETIEELDEMLEVMYEIDGIPDDWEENRRLLIESWGLEESDAK